jgi:hypothetical protein
MLRHITYVTLVTVMVMLILLVWRIGFGMTRMEFVGVMPTVQGLSGAMLEDCATSIRLSEDNHDSWVTCTTSAECKTVITAVLTVMSVMHPHMISWNLRWVWFGLVGWSMWILLGCGSVTV